MNTKTFKIFLAVFVQLAIVLTVTGVKYTQSVNGVEVLLKIRPVDPTDILRGDYVTLAYDIDRFQIRDGYVFEEGTNTAMSGFKSYMGYVGEMQKDDVVYVGLERMESSKYWGFSGHISTQMPEFVDPTREVYLKGVIESEYKEDVGSAPEGDEYYRYSSQVQHITIRYNNLDRYDIPQGTGQGFDPAKFEFSVRVNVKPRDGNAVIKQVYKDGVPWP
ncbi:MAG TPA: GDYXXLXY domain-containing protein [Patescibacteria group bacterium]|nr:GDYXXLXY domain-containing protein [Patescibacteria group bacterium]